VLEGVISDGGFFDPLEKLRNSWVSCVKRRLLYTPFGKCLVGAAKGGYILANCTVFLV